MCGSYSYVGDWVDDEMHGQGKFTFASGATYHGCFDHNKFHGQGTYTFPDGKQYQVLTAVPATHYRSTDRQKPEHKPRDLHDTCSSVASTASRACSVAMCD